MVRNTYKGLGDKREMDFWARFINCLIHVLNKFLENACRAVFGRQGMGQNTCLQMIISIITVYKRIKEEGGIALSDHIQSLVVGKFVASGEWQKEAAENCVQAFDKAMDDLECDDIEEVMGLLKAPRNIQDPV